MQRFLPGLRVASTVTASIVGTVLLLYAIFVRVVSSAFNETDGKFDDADMFVVVACLIVLGAALAYPWPLLAVWPCGIGAVFLIIPALDSTGNDGTFAIVASLPLLFVIPAAVLTGIYRDVHVEGEAANISGLGKMWTSGWSDRR